jgi:hypothetical protein
MPGASKTFPVGITERGLISGYFYDSVGAHGFLLKDGRFTKVDYATGYDTYLLKINDQGQVAGFCFAHDGTSPIYGFVFKNGQFTFFQAPPFAFDPSVTAINDEGTLAGQYDTGDPAASYSYVQSRAGFRRVDFPGAFATTLNDLNDRGDIVGSADHPFTVHSAFYRRGEEWLHLLYGGGYTELTGCNNHGDATGIYYDYVLRRYRGLLLNPIRQPN